jgi:hypothetical protein
MSAEAESSSDELEAFRQLDAVDLEQRRRHLRETTMAERIEEALRLGELARELRQGMVRALQ